MSMLKLSNSSLEVAIDGEDFERLSKFIWRLESRDGNPHRVVRSDGRRRSPIPIGAEILRHNVLVVDHINRNPLDNRKENLRLADYSDNAANRTKTLYTTSQYKGVSFRASRNCFQAEITFDGKRHYLGNFKDEKLAAKAYNDKAIELFKEFACLNKID